jgi:DNA-binding LytR/AlgR family response regulator
MKIAICDDEKMFLNKIHNDLLALQTNDTFTIVEYMSGEDLLCDFSADMFDIVILDIEMKELNGMETAEYIRKIDKCVTIIFLTNYESFALKGYQVGAFRYILKEQPDEFYKQQLYDTVQSIYNKRKYISVNIENEMRKIAVEDITYIEIYGHKLLLHLINSDDAIAYRGTLKETEVFLTGLNFTRSDKSHLVNASKIKSIVDDLIILEDCTQLYISRKYKKSVLNAFMDCIRRRCG